MPPVLPVVEAPGRPNTHEQRIAAWAKDSGLPPEQHPEYLADEPGSDKEHADQMAYEKGQADKAAFAAKEKADAAAAKEKADAAAARGVDPVKVTP